jgi:hypothetical protein
MLLEKYLCTVYRPDRDYADGEVLERNWGELRHSDTQSAFAHHFRVRRREWKTHAFVAQRVQVADTRIRVPDVCVMVGKNPATQSFAGRRLFVSKCCRPKTGWGLCRSASTTT